MCILQNEQIAQVTKRIDRLGTPINIEKEVERERKRKRERERERERYRLNDKFFSKHNVVICLSMTIVNLREIQSTILLMISCFIVIKWVQNKRYATMTKQREKVSTLFQKFLCQVLSRYDMFDHLSSTLCSNACSITNKQQKYKCHHLNMKMSVLCFGGSSSSLYVL